MADSGGGTGEIEEKVAYFQAVTGLDDPDLCAEILSAHNWDLDLAVSAISSNPSPLPSVAPSSAAPSASSASTSNPRVAPAPAPGPAPAPAPPGLAWRLVTLPFYVVSGGVGLVAGAVGLGAWVAGGVLSRSLGLLGLLPPRDPSADQQRLIHLSPSALEAAGFVAGFEHDFPGPARPRFVSDGFMEALNRARREFKLMFVYIHSPDHPDVPTFCAECLCSDAVAAFLDENFVCWGGSVRGSEGFKMSNSLKASRFPFCAVVSPDNQQIVLLRQIEGLKSPEEMLRILQRVVDEVTPTLLAARLEAEERRNNIRLREEQDAAYRAALEADRARELQMKEEQERLQREAAEAARRLKEEEEAREQEAREAAEREAARARKRQEKAMSLGPEPEKGPDVTQVLVRFPTGERKERRFHSSATVKSVYDYVDSLDCLNAENYCLISNFPRISYGSEKHELTLKEAGLHPQASLFVEIDS